MTEDFIALRPIRVFGDALRPVIGKLEERINETPVPGEWQDDVFEFIANCLRRIEDDVETLADTVNSELNSVVAGEADDADIWRAVARLEVRIERLADGYDEVRGAECDIEDTQGLSLLGDVYHDLLKQVLAWLNEIIEFVDKPLVFLRQRGLATEGKVDLELGLTFETPAEIDGVNHWAERRAAKLRAPPPPDFADDQREIEAERGLLLLVLGAFGLGWMLGDDE